MYTVTFINMNIFSQRVDQPKPSYSFGLLLLLLLLLLPLELPNRFLATDGPPAVAGPAGVARGLPVGNLGLPR
jgi:hypothetical protein